MKARLVSIFVTVAVLTAGVGAYAATRSGGDVYTVTADVAQAPNLFEGGRVMVRGVDVGRIAGVEPRPEGVRLTLELRSEVPVPAEATLGVIPVTVIADRYVQLFPAYEDGPKLSDGAHIPITRTSIPAELDDVLTQLQGLLAALEPADGEDQGALAKLVESLDKVFAGRSKELAGTLSGSAEVLDNLASSGKNINSLITNLDTLFFALANRSSEIALVNERFAAVTSALLADQENLEGTIENIAFLSDEVAGLLSTSGDTLGESFGRLGTVLNVVLKHQDQVARGIQWGNVIAQSLGATNKGGKGLFAYSGKQAQPGTDGAEYNYRLDSRDSISCERINQVAISVLVVTPQGGIDGVMDTLLSFIPDPYDEDLAFLLRQLALICVEQFNPNSLDARAKAAIKAIVADVGEARFKELLGRWFAEGMHEVHR